MAEREDDDYGPHYIPELDPGSPQHQIGSGERLTVRIIAYASILGFALWIGAGVAWYSGMDQLMMGLVIAGAICLALVFLLIAFGS